MVNNSLKKIGGDNLNRILIGMYYLCITIVLHVYSIKMYQTKSKQHQNVLQVCSSVTNLTFLDFDDVLMRMC